MLPALLLLAANWAYWGGDPGGTKYSALKQVNKSNVGQLRPAWIFDAGDFSDGKKLPVTSAFEATPLFIDGILYVSTPFHRLFALDAETGKIVWQFDPKFDTGTRVTLYQSRGVSYWSKGHEIVMADQMGRLFRHRCRDGKAELDC